MNIIESLLPRIEWIFMLNHVIVININDSQIPCTLYFIYGFHLRMFDRLVLRILLIICFGACLFSLLLIFMVLLLHFHTVVLLINIIWRDFFHVKETQDIHVLILCEICSQKSLQSFRVETVGLLYNSGSNLSMFELQIRIFCCREEQAHCFLKKIVDWRWRVFINFYYLPYA